MKTKRYIPLLLCAILLMSILGGCGAKNAAGSAQNVSLMSADAAAPMEAPRAGESAVDTLTDSGGAASAALPESRKWIVIVHMSAETDDLDVLTAALDEKIASLGGYVEDQHIYNGSTYANHRYRSASLTIRVPAEDVDGFAQEVSGIANVVSKEKNLEDVTLNYVATESRVTALETEQTRLLELLAQAETMSDLLEIEARLTDVRYELENYTSQLRLYDNQIDYATIYLSIEEVQEYTPVEDPTLWERIRGGFISSLKGLGENIVDLLVWIIIASPYLITIGAVLLVLILLIKRTKKTRTIKKENTPKEQK